MNLNPLNNSLCYADTDAVARQAGLRRTVAWVQDEVLSQDATPAQDVTPLHAAASGAERTRRSRIRAEQAGNKQISVMVPLEHHALLREFAERTRNGQSAAMALNAMLETVRTQAPPLPFWRRWLIQRLLPIA